MSSISISILVALGAAITFGAADFSGGLVSKRTSSIGVVLLCHLFSLLFLIPLALLFDDRFLSIYELIFGILSGVAGGFGLILLYRALAEGQMSLVSPVSALVAASLPVLVGLWIEGFPGYLMLAGFALALLSIWLIAKTGKISLTNALVQLRIPLFSGILFGLFFIGMYRASGSTVIWPVVATRIGSIPAILLFTLLTRQRALPQRIFWGRVLLISILDTVGNICFIIASRLGRLDLAAVISSLYPGGTVALAWMILKEKLTRSQWLGVGTALLALVLISL